ncbi:MAG TPA: V-type ATP synthase subunit F, partial [Nitrososphaeraceae archaeon]|nr:V-type ATP synthase subunit F [Nitrososphaeraceae archaeon]
MRLIAIGSRVFVTSLRLAGVQGIIADSAGQALSQIKDIGSAEDVGLVLLSDDIGKDIRYKLTEMRAKRPIPLIFELPSPGSK